MNTRSLSIGISPCPNDTFIFYGLLSGNVAARGLSFTAQFEDVETLNRLAMNDELDICKISYHALAYVRDCYWLLRSGGALGRGCGPLLVAKKPLDLQKLYEKKIAIPGSHTTAALLLKLFAPAVRNLVVMPFHQIMESVASGEVDAGVIIHESRFTYKAQGLLALLDLGAWWEQETGEPIPLGGIIARRALPLEDVRWVEEGIRGSLRFSRTNPEKVSAFVRQYAQEMDDEVCAAHIGLYVTPFSEDLGLEGERAVRTLLQRGEELGVIPRSKSPLFLPG